MNIYKKRQDANTTIKHVLKISIGVFMKISKIHYKQSTVYIRYVIILYIKYIIDKIRINEIRIDKIY